MPKFHRFKQVRITTARLIRKYAESMTRRNFGTEDAMKLGKPLPKE